RQSNDRLRIWQNLVRIAAFLLAALHVIHFAVRAFAQPLTKVICVCGRIARGNATGIKPDLSRKRDQSGLQLCCRNLYRHVVGGIDDPGFGLSLLSLLRIATATSSSVSTEVSTRMFAIFA